MSLPSPLIHFLCPFLRCLPFTFLTPAPDPCSQAKIEALAQALEAKEGKLRAYKSELSAQTEAMPRMQQQLASLAAGEHAVGFVTLSLWV